MSLEVRMVLPGKGISWKEFLVGIKNEWLRDNLGDVAGSLTFFAVLALFPFLLFLVALASVLIDPRTAEALVAELSRVAPSEVTDIIGQRIRELGRANNVGLLTVSALGAIWAASGGTHALMRALNAAYDVRDSRPFWKTRGLAIVMTIVTAALALTAALIVVALPPLADRFGGPLGSAVQWLRIPVAGLIMMLVWALLYYFLPDVEQRFRFITPGSIVGVLIWALASWGFSVYVRNFGNFTATYGTLGGVIVLLFWMWISSQVVLLGAEINAFLEHRSAEGKRVGAKSMEDAGPDLPKSEKHDVEQQRLEQLAAKALRPEPRPHRRTLWMAIAGLSVLAFRRRAT